MMNNRGHLPAGQPMQGGVDMAAGPGHGPGGPRRGAGRHTQHYAAQHAYQQANPLPSQYVYPPGYINPYGAPQPYYLPQQPHQYQNGGMPSPGYGAGYHPPPAYSRSPPSMPQYAPLVAHGSYGRPPSHSPVVPAPYQAPPPPPPPPPAMAVAPLSAAIPPPPQTPSSTHSSYMAPPLLSPSVSQNADNLIPEFQAPPPQMEHDTPLQALPSPTTTVSSYPTSVRVLSSPCVSLPWLSRPEDPFPRRATRSRRRRRILRDVEVVEYSGNMNKADTEASSETLQDDAPELAEEKQNTSMEVTSTPTRKAGSQEMVPDISSAERSETPCSQPQHSEAEAVSSPVTPNSVLLAQPASSIELTPKSVKPATRSVLPPAPVVPALPKAGLKEVKAPTTTSGTAQPQPTTSKAGNTAAPDTPQSAEVEASEEATVAEPGVKKAEAAEATQGPAPAPAKQKPTLWSGLFNKATPAANSVNAANSKYHSHMNGAAPGGSGASLGVEVGSSKSNNGLVEVLEAYRVGHGNKVAFLRPQGLQNTGNMCYMNAVLQVLLFCVPFYDFLDQVSKKSAFSFKSETPLLDAMINFMREFKIVDSAVSGEQLRLRLKSEDYDKYGDQIAPDYVYDAIQKVPRFANMKRGHQQDAQEFLTLLLQTIHEECAKAMSSLQPSEANSSLPSPTTSPKNGATEENKWFEVGHRQRATITRSSGHLDVSTPVSKIFGGQSRSELRVPGLKPSVTIQPYQSLQLDIGAPDVRNILDALKGSTRPEVIQGDFKSPHGKDVKATKQIFVETLPPVLILHLKRFEYDANAHGTVKIWKKIGYPLELDMPRELLIRNKLAPGEAAPRYRLNAVVYHHGKNANDGHYTTDVRRQDGQEWIHIDDTSIRRIRAEAVAEGGAEEEAPKHGGAHAADASCKENGNGNRFAGMGDEETGDDDGWKPAPASGKKWSSVVNGQGPGSGSTTSASGAKAKQQQQIKESVRDNKVAYLLFYQRI